MMSFLLILLNLVLLVGYQHMKRRIFTIVSALSLVVFVAIGTIGILSFWFDIWVSYSSALKSGPYIESSFILEWQLGYVRFDRESIRRPTDSLTRILHLF